MPRLGFHPLNLAFRFCLEVASLVALGVWGWGLTDTWLKYVYGFGAPLFAAALWGTFAVPNDPSRSGKAPIPVPGIVRLAFELFVFSFAVWGLYASEYIFWSLVLGILVAIHYLLSFDRISWLIKN